jgi:signal transduction histidine kinase
MKSLGFEHQIYLDAFMKTAQYLASLPTHDDIWRHIVEVMVKFYGADLVGFARRSDGGMELHHLKLPASFSRELLKTKDIQEAIAEVLESGFLTWRIIHVDEPYTIVFLPVSLSNRTAAVMLVGHATSDPISNELLNVYLAVSGLAGSTITRLNSEIELKGRRTRLEELVAERTIHLTRTMEQLGVEIAERKRAEEALRGAKDELELRVQERTRELIKANEDLKEKTRIAQTLLDALPCIALLLRFDKVVVGSNKRASDLGIVPGTVCYKAWDAPDKPCPWCNPVDTLQEGTIQREEIEVGERCWETYWVPINSDLFLHYAFDVSDRKKSERELKAYAQRLEILNRELQEFAFVASHDLQEPLRKIQAFGNILEVSCKDCLTEEGRDYLTRMSKSANRMSALLDALLGYSRVATKPEPFKETDLSEIVQDAVSDLELSITSVKGCVEIGNLPRVEVDSTQMRQLFQNLIANALKYSSKKEPPHIKVYGEVVERTCTLYVEDNGIGFNETYIDRIFRPFQRLHGRNEYEGTGMGLAICRKIAERHGGVITARSTPGQGSVFIVTLPTRQVGKESYDRPGQ